MTLTDGLERVYKNQYNAEWRKNNYSRWLAYQRRYCKEWNKQHPERRARYNKVWKALNPEKVAASNERNKAKQKVPPTPGICDFCGSDFLLRKGARFCTPNCSKKHHDKRTGKTHHRKVLSTKP